MLRSTRFDASSRQSGERSARSGLTKPSGGLPASVVSCGVALYLGHAAPRAPPSAGAW